MGIAEDFKLLSSNPNFYRKTVEAYVSVNYFSIPLTYTQSHARGSKTVLGAVTVIAVSRRVAYHHTLITHSINQAMNFYLKGITVDNTAPEITL